MTDTLSTHLPGAKKLRTKTVTLCMKCCDLYTIIPRRQESYTKPWMPFSSAKVSIQSDVKNPCGRGLAEETYDMLKIWKLFVLPNRLDSTNFFHNNKSSSSSSSGGCVLRVVDVYSCGVAGWMCRCCGGVPVLGVVGWMWKDGIHPLRCIQEKILSLEYATYE
jgi:hypothetical protein